MTQGDPIPPPPPSSDPFASPTGAPPPRRARVSRPPAVRAMANMTAVTQKCGASRIAFLVVPVVGAFFSSVLNNVAIQLFLSWM